MSTFGNIAEVVVVIGSSLRSWATEAGREKKRDWNFYIKSTEMLVGHA